MTSLFKKFTYLFTQDKNIYVNAARVNEHYKQIVRGSNQIQLINDLKLDYIVVMRRGKQAGEVVAIDINSDKFIPQNMNILVKLKQLKRNKELMKRIKNSPDKLDKEFENKITDSMISRESRLESEYEYNFNDKEITNMFDDRELTNNEEYKELPVIELEEHEKFTDINDKVINITIRGERTKDNIFFKAKDIGDYFNMDDLLRTILNHSSSYQYNTDFVLLGKTESGYYNHYEFLKKSRLNHNDIYLTLAGFIRVVFVSRSANANILKVFDWIQTLFFVYKFGSLDEKNELSNDLFKCCLNDKLSGLYYIDLGTFDDLYESMNIDRNKYPSKIYGKHHIGKFGLSQNISNRINQHKNEKNGYGQYNNIKFKWLILLSPSQLNEAETLLSNLLQSKGFMFKHDDGVKNHNELIMFKSKDEIKIKDIYKQILTLYPSKENELSKIIEEMRSNHNNKLIEQKYEYETKLHNYDIEAINAKNELEVIKYKHETEIVKLSAQNEILNLKLQISDLQKKL